MAKRKSIIPGFSWNRALGITSAKQKIARATGIPTTKQGRKRKLQSSLWTAVAFGLAASASNRQSAPQAASVSVSDNTSKTRSALYAERGDMFSAAAYAIFEAGSASVSILQRKLKLGYSQAASLMDELSANGVVGAFEGSSPREILMTPREFEAVFCPQKIDLPESHPNDFVHAEAGFPRAVDPSAPVSQRTMSQEEYEDAVRAPRMVRKIVLIVLSVVVLLYIISTYAPDLFYIFQR